MNLCNKAPGIVQIALAKLYLSFLYTWAPIILSDNVQVVKEESPWLRNLTGHANPQQDSNNEAAAQFVHEISILAQQNWVFKRGLKQQNWLKLENKLHGHNQGESSAQMLSNLPVHPAPFSPEIFSPDSLHYNLGNTKKGNWAIILW